MKKFVKIVTIFLAMAMTLGMSITCTFAKEAEDAIEKGVFIGTVDVSGMTMAEAEKAVSDYVKTLSGRKLTLEAKNNNTATVTMGQLGLSWDNQNVVEEAVALGKTGNIIKRYKILKDLEHRNEVLPLELSYDNAKIKKYIEDNCLKFNVEPVDGTLVRENGEFKFEGGQTGVEINVSQSADAIEEYLTSDWDKEDASFELVMETALPRGNEEDFAKIKDVLGTFTTSYSTSGANRSGNVANGCSKINGTLLYPGDTFSTYETISPFTEANGYYMAGSYLNGLVVESLGGGICQVSTTLYNAVLRAELEVLERSNHSMIVTYVDPSADAAISSGTKDFKFKNSLDYPIYIEGSTTSDKKITFTIYGVETRPSNREVSFESKVIQRIDATGEKVVADGSHGAGYVSVQSAHTGYVAELWKIVKVDGVEESRTQVNDSRYNAVPRTAAVGTATSNPSASAAIHAAIATGSIDQCRATAAAINAGTYNDPAAQLQAQFAAALAAQAAAQQ